MPLWSPKPPPWLPVCHKLVFDFTSVTSDFVEDTHTHTQACVKHSTVLLPPTTTCLEKPRKKTTPSAPPSFSSSVKTCPPAPHQPIECPHRWRPTVAPQQEVPPPAPPSVVLLVVDELLRALGQPPVFLLLQLQRRFRPPGLVHLHGTEAQAEHQRLQGQDVEEQGHVVQRLGVTGQR